MQQSNSTLLRKASLENLSLFLDTGDFSQKFETDWMPPHNMVKQVGHHSSAWAALFRLASLGASSYQGHLL